MESLPPNRDPEARRAIHRFYRVPLEHLAYLRFIVESYEGLAQLTSFPGRAEVEWTIPASLAGVAQALAAALATEIPMVPIIRPEDWPSPDLDEPP